MSGKVDNSKQYYGIKMQLLSQLWFVVFLSEHIASHVNLKMLLSSYKRLSYKNIELMRMDKFMSWMSCQLVLSRLLQPTCVPNHSDFLLGFIGYTCLSACCFYWLSRVTTRNTSESAIPGRYSMVRCFQICSYRFISIFFGCFQ